MPSMSQTRYSCLELLGCAATIPINWIWDRHSNTLVVDVCVCTEMVGGRVVDRLGGGDFPDGPRRSFRHWGHWHIHVVPVAPSVGLARRVVGHPSHVGVAGVDTDVFLESSWQHVNVHVVGVAGGLGGVVGRGGRQVVYVHVVWVWVGRCVRVVGAHVHVVVSRHLGGSIVE